MNCFEKKFLKLFQGIRLHEKIRFQRGKELIVRVFAKQFSGWEEK